MKPMKLTEEEANNKIREYLLKQTDCGEKMQIFTNITNEKITHYYVYEEISHHNEKVKRLSILSFTDYIRLLKSALQEKGYDVYFINPIIREDLRYEIHFRVYDLGNSRKRVRR